MFVVSDWRSLMGLRVRFAGQLRGYSDPAYRRSEMSRLSRQNPQSNGRVRSGVHRYQDMCSQGSKGGCDRGVSSRSGQSIMFRSEGMANEGPRK